MIIFPAIDLKNGEAVRLTQGDYNQVKVYFKNPAEVLEFFKKIKLTLNSGSAVSDRVEDRVRTGDLQIHNLAL